MRLRSSAAAQPGHDGLNGFAAAGATGRPRLGELLVESGELDETDVRDVLDRQEQSSRLFGETCVDLGLSSPDSVRRMLNKQFRFDLLAPGDDRIDPAVVTAFGLDPAMTEGLRSLRASLLGRQTSRGELLATIVLAGTGMASGISIFAANFAVICAQLGNRVLLVDANFADPVQHHLFRVPNRQGLTTLLAAGREEAPAIVETALGRLSLLPAGPLAPNPAELLEREPPCARLRAVAARYDVILVDAGTQDPDIVAAIAAGSDGAVVVIERHRTAVGQVNRILTHFENREVKGLGAVLV